MKVLSTVTRAVEKLKKDYLTQQKLSNRGKTDSDTVSTVVCIIVLFLFALVAFNIVMRGATEANQNYKRQQVEDLWEKAFNSANNSKVVKFNETTTSVDEYCALREACIKYIEQNSKEITIDKSVAVDVDSSDGIYSDKAEHKSESSIDNIQFTDGEYIPDMEYWLRYINKKPEADNNILVEFEPIYFDNIVMARYINANGDLAVVTSAIDSNNDNELLVIKQSELTDKLYNVAFSSNSLVNILDNVDYNSEIFSEEQYVSAVVNTICSMINNNDVDVDSTMIMNYAKFITKDGREAVVSIKDKLKLRKGETVYPVIALIGGTDSTRAVKNRIYLQLAVDRETEDCVVNMLIKMNNDMRVFDVDKL